MKKSLLLICQLFIPGLAAFAAEPLTESTFTEIIRDAKVVAAADKNTVPARTNMVFHAPDRVRTGTASRVEMTATDKTITRIGANTIFTFAEGERTIELEKGSILFHAPAGVGGGTIQYRGTAAAVMGTTMICAVLPDGGFKIMDLEGRVKVTLKNGTSIVLKAGQLVIVPPDGGEFHKPEYFNISKAISRLVLMVGFSQPLSSLPLILDAIRQQDKDFADGTITFVVDNNDADFGLEIVHRAADPGFVRPPETYDHTLTPITPTMPK